MKKILAIFFALTLMNCGGSKNSHETSESQVISEGFEILDQGRFEDALLYFEGVYETRPSDDVLKAWASVYVARAGVKISSLYKAFSTFPSETQVTKDNFLVQIQAYKTSLEKIPYVQGEDRNDLRSATALLMMRKTQSVRLFRGILNLVLLRSAFSDGDKVLAKINLQVNLDKDLKPLCKFDWKKLTSWLQVWPLYGIELKKDLDLAFPSDQKKWAEGEKLFLESRKFAKSLAFACDL